MRLLRKSIYSLLLLGIITGVFVVANGGIANADKVVRCIGSAGYLLNCIKNPVRETFITRCVTNNNQRQECTCTYNAIPELSKEYSKLAKTWAIENENEFYIQLATIIGVPVNEFHQFQKDFHGWRKQAYKKSTSSGLSKLQPRKFKDLILWTRKRVFSWKFVNNAKKATIIGAVVNLVPLATKAANAKIVLDKHCNGQTKAIYPYLKKAENLAEKTIDYAKNKTVGAGKSVKEAAKSSWDFTKNISRKTKQWLLD